MRSFLYFKVRLYEKLIVKKTSFQRKSKFRTNVISLSVCLCILTGMAVSGCTTRSEAEENAAFEAYTMEVFRIEAASNTVNLHYTLRDPQQYGIQEPPVSFGSFEANSEEVRAVTENMQNALLRFDYSSLDIQNKITYEVLNYYLRSVEKAADLILYDEPLGLVSGIQTQLPVILSEYPLYERGDVDTYLELMKTTGDYFDSLIGFERDKAEAGLFMADYALDAVLDQCRAFLNMGEENYLYSTFSERIGEVEGLTDNEKNDYIQKNAGIIEDYVLPAYEKLISALESMRGSGENEKGLIYLPEGREYYEMTVKQSTGSERSIGELEDLTRRQIVADLEAMEQVLGLTADEASEAAAVVMQNNPEQILGSLKEEIGNAFPAAPETDLQVKYVPEAMEEHLSPAFYMIPAIDNTEENVIYINEAHMGDTLTLFTTLAHEGYPGHLYQTVYYEGTDPDPVRNIFNFGGYVEGWATYAEMCSYYLTPLTTEQATLLQKNSSIILGLYALADMGIHYEGWSRMDTTSFFSSYGITDSETVEQIYELIIGSPGNYLKYYVGYVEFLELKKEWIEERGDAFSQKEFHEAVLNVGPAPFEIVREYMWEV